MWNTASPKRDLFVKVIIEGKLANAKEFPEKEIQKLARGNQILDKEIQKAGVLPVSTNAKSLQKVEKELRGQQRVVMVLVRMPPTKEGELCVNSWNGSDLMRGFR
jgi:hypothetical protein